MVGLWRRLDDWRQHVGVRGRVLGVAVAILLLTLSAWAWVSFALFEDTLARGARLHARVQATALAADLEERAPSEVVPTREGEQYGDVTVQVLDADDRIVAASTPDARSVVLTSLRPKPGQLLSQEVDTLPGIDQDRFVIVATGATGEDGERWTVVVASPVHVEEGTATRLYVLGGVAGTLVLLVTAVLVRFAVGSALRPVERLRGQLAGIDGRTMGDRVDVPTTGDELTALGDTMNQMLTRLEGAYATQRTFVSDASHELRSPLATVRASVELAAADPSGRIWAQNQDVLLAEILRLQRLVDDLLTLSRYDGGALPLRMRECDLDDLVVRATRRLAEETAHEVSVEVAPVRVCADPDRIGQVLRNLLDNAGRHARSAVRIRLEGGRSAAVTVDNDGPPVPPDERDRVFERFVRLDGTRDRDSGGSGLGLAIAADLVTGHGGTLTTGEAADGWCRFTMTLPLTPAD